MGSLTHRLVGTHWRNQAQRARPLVLLDVTGPVPVWSAVDGAFLLAGVIVARQALSHHISLPAA